MIDDGYFLFDGFLCLLQNCWWFIVDNYEICLKKYNEKKKK